MLSVTQCRELLGEAGQHLSDGDIELLRDQLHVVAEVALTTAQAVLRSESKTRREAWKAIPSDDLADIHERAAIMEFEGGLKQDDAERRSIAAYFERRNQA